MSAVLAITMALIALTASIGPAYRQWKTDPRGFWITLRYLALYAFGCATGVVVLVWLAPRNPTNDTGIALTIFAVAWIAYCALWLYRLVPDYKDYPNKPLKRIGPVDAVVLGTLAIAFSTAL